MHWRWRSGHESCFVGHLDLLDMSRRLLGAEVPSAVGWGALQHLHSVYERSSILKSADSLFLLSKY